MPAERIFDGWAEDFEQEIYGSSKGYIRLNVLWHDLTEAIPHLQDGQWRILDVGGGTGPLALLLAKRGHRIVLADPSADMLAVAARKLNAHGLQDHVQLVESSLQQLPTRISGPFDLVLCHAVLEWLVDPRQALFCLSPWLSPAGLLSLLYYNQHAVIATALLAGDFSTAWRYLDGGTSPSGYRNQSHPLDPQVVTGWLHEAGWEIIHTAGIRIFHDHLPDHCKSGPELEKLLQTEKQLRTKEPFASLGQHIHVICRVQPSPPQ